MKVELVTITPNAETNIMFMARVSNPANQNSESTKLIDYCIKNAHWSIFEMAHLTVEIETSRAIAAQILRHKSFSFQEFSQRYAKVDSDAFEIYPARSQDVKNRQNSVDNMDEDTKKWFETAQNTINNQAMQLYEAALEKGVAKEQARFLLPLSTRSKLYMSGSIRSWIHYLDLRCANGTQKEHKDIADAIKQIFIKGLPVISAAKNWS